MISAYPGRVPGDDGAILDNEAACRELTPQAASAEMCDGSLHLNCGMRLPCAELALRPAS